MSGRIRAGRSEWHIFYDRCPLRHRTAWGGCNVRQEREAVYWALMPPLRVAGGLEEVLRLHMDPGVAFISTGEVMFLA